MDLTIDLGENRLNVRASAIIIHEGKVLLHKNVNEDHYALLGGRVKVGENSQKTVIREIKEELGKEIELTGYVTTVENFFEFKETKIKYHEILFVHKAEFTNEEDKKINYTLKNKEGKDHLNYEWIDLDKIEEYNILPKCMKQILKNIQDSKHCINDEIENNFKYN